ncbi:MAG: hypothetical protein ISR65_18595 [Bacteriovoracaceae bacterium]|nr:hypothetical protein [Bacteriovoracaceae bacterium]
MNLPSLVKKKIAFTTRELAFELGKSTNSVSRSLKNLHSLGEIKRVSRGIWANVDHPHFSPYYLVQYLLGDEQGYISFLSALHRYDIISQIPSTIQVATSGRNRSVSSEIGDFEFIKIKPELMCDGFSLWGDIVSYNLASREKALFDCLYISTRKGNRFSRFPELDLSQVKQRKIISFIHQLIKCKSIQSAMKKRLENL